MLDYGSIIDAGNAWRDAERAYQMEAASHWVWLIEGESPPERIPPVYSPEARDAAARERGPRASRVLRRSRQVLTARGAP
jgi:hypothetical protein